MPGTFFWLFQNLWGWERPCSVSKVKIEVYPKSSLTGHFDTEGSHLHLFHPVLILCLLSSFILPHCFHSQPCSRTVIVRQPERQIRPTNIGKDINGINMLVTSGQLTSWIVQISQEHGTDLGTPSRIQPMYFISVDANDASSSEGLFCKFSSGYLRYRCFWPILRTGWPRPGHFLDFDTINFQSDSSRLLNYSKYLEQTTTERIDFWTTQTQDVDENVIPRFSS